MKLLSNYTFSLPPLPGTLLINVSTRDKQLSGYLFWGITTSSIQSNMTLTSKTPIRNLQYPPSTPLLDRIFLTLPIPTSTHTFPGMFLRDKQDHPKHLGLPCPLSLIILRVPQFLSSPFLTHL